MTDQAAVNQNAENKPSDKEINFRKLEAKYQQQLEQERNARLEAERIAQEAMSKKQIQDDEEDDDPYVDRKKLEKKLNSFGEQNRKQTQQEIQMAVQEAIAHERKDSWLKQNPEFTQVMSNPENMEKFYQHDPELAETILKMPEGFERQKLVYKNIKALGLDKPTQKQPTIQDKIDANKRSPYYQPSGVATAPYASNGDFSASGQKNAYAKMKELQSRWRS